MAVKAAKGFTLDEGPGERLQRTPPGFPKDFRYADYLKCRQYCLAMPIKEEDISVDNVLSAFRSTKRYMDFIAKAMVSPSKR